MKVASTEQAPQERSWAGKAASFLGAPTPGEPDASGINATIGRVATGIIGGVPDMAIKVQNAGLNPFDMVGRGVDKLMGNAPPPRIPEVTPLLRQATGTPELPEDASTARRALEGAATVAGGGGAQAVGRAIQAAPTAAAAVMPAAAAATRNIVAPLVGSEVGGKVGEKVGGEKGQVLGSLLGGMVSNVPGPSSAVERYYGRQARPDAPAIAAAAERQGITPTAGMLGNEKIQEVERAISGRGTLPMTNNPVVAARERTLVQMREQADQHCRSSRSSTPEPTAGTIGEHVLDTAEQTATELARAELRGAAGNVRPGRTQCAGEHRTGVCLAACRDRANGSDHRAADADAPRCARADDAARPGRPGRHQPGRPGQRAIRRLQGLAQRSWPQHADARGRAGRSPGSDLRSCDRRHARGRGLPGRASGTVRRHAGHHAHR